MKKTFIALILWFLIGTTYSQPNTLHSFVTGSNMAGNNNTYFVIGQSLSGQTIGNGYEVSVGIADAQLVRDTVYDVITFNTPYTKNFFNLPAQNTSHVDSVYVLHGGVSHYDLIRKLRLIVCPENVTDFYSSSTSYDVIAVSGHCWTKQNLRSPVEGAMTYTSLINSTIPESYGMLYTWQTASAGMTSTGNDTVRGICPENWYIPNAIEIDHLTSNSAESLRNTEGWVLPNANTNNTGFTAYPAGFYNSTTGRFEGLGTQTDWWTTVNANTSCVGENSTNLLQIDYYCDTPRITPHNLNDAFSVRCVMVNNWPK